MISEQEEPLLLLRLGQRWKGLMKCFDWRTFVRIAVCDKIATKYGKSAYNMPFKR